MPSDRSLRAMNRIHRIAMRVSGGRLGWSIAGMPVVELTTTGRRSGAQRTTLLTAPLQRAGGYVVVASRGGDDRHPAWFLNLQADPDVTVQIKDEEIPVRMRVAEGEERERLWALMNEVWPDYETYQTKTDRQIPVVVLSRA